jgi:hypothetical protein
MTKIDAVIEAVRYKGNRIELVRAYERRGPTFSDYVLIDRPGLIARLQKGQEVVTGRRREFMASTFEVHQRVLLTGRNGDQVVTTDEGALRDRLEGVPVF